MLFIKISYTTIKMSILDLLFNYRITTTKSQLKLTLFYFKKNLTLIKK